MEKNFTQNHLIKLLYGETSAEESRAIVQRLRDDNSLYEEFEGLRHAYLQLPKVKFNASFDSIQRILNHSAVSLVESN